MTKELDDLVDVKNGFISRELFVDPAIYREELNKLFTRAWLLVGHESLVPAADDFFHTYMGEDPVILTRDARGRLHALLNMCRHRGNRVVRCDDGNAARFMCTYHGWTYANDGRLEHVPGASEAYYDALDTRSLGLVRARVETYAGIVFATWAADAPCLAAMPPTRPAPTAGARTIASTPAAFDPSPHLARSSSNTTSTRGSVAIAGPVISNPPASTKTTSWLIFLSPRSSGIAIAGTSTAAGAVSGPARAAATWNCPARTSARAPAC